ncbi:hypothetical protein [Selenomonas sp. FOBRC9]|uniref:hypothetical protein n=1 Tax=Selenomonas sp. FOBRC9 TaxID=936573 RepID=UPI00055D15DB|nr:hypothetical protein [Selenomonas sp. FOBRC9]
MSDMYSVAISYGDVLGWIDYDADARTATVNLADEKGRAAAEAFLAADHEVEVPHETLMDFTKESVTPLADRDSFELALTRLWNETGVQVDWSRPVDYVKAHPHY